MTLRLTGILAAAMHRLRDHAALVCLTNVDESTFRSFVLTEVKRRDRSTKCQTEWHSIDLLVQTAKQNIAVELKFYIRRRTVGLDRKPGDWKSGPGRQNEREFWECVEKLHGLGWPGIDRKYIVLVYERGTPPNCRKSFDEDYGGLAPGKGIKAVTTVRHDMEDRLICKLIEIA